MNTRPSLKVMLTSELKMTCRSWVVWYYTFGVNCKANFSRSHTHLFYMVKDPKSFTFNADSPALRVPSARQLVYGDRRANPKGRLPDNTWILRPQDVPEAFHTRRRHLVLLPSLRHVQGTHRLAHLPNARAIAGPDHRSLQQSGRTGARSLRRQRDHLGRGEKTGQTLFRL